MLGRLVSMLAFFKSVPGLIILAVMAASAAVVSSYMTSREKRAAPPPRAIIEEAEKNTQPAQAFTGAIQSFGDRFSDLVVPSVDEQTKDAPPPIPDEIKARIIATPKPLTLFSPTSPKPPQPPPASRNKYLPSRQLIVCRLVNAVDSANIETPLIAQVVENVYNMDENGEAQLVIPAGIQIHGIASGARMRDRISASGQFTLVWRTQDPETNGLELSFNGLALNREYDPVSKTYGFEDGSAGIKGIICNSNTNEEIKLFIAAALAGMAPSLQDTNTLLNQFTNQAVEQPKLNLGNALIQGASASLQQLTERIRATIDKDGFYVAVRPGKQFYVYNTQPINLADARRAGAYDEQQRTRAANALAQLAAIQEAAGESLAEKMPGRSETSKRNP